MAKRLSRYVEAVRLGAQPDFKNPVNNQFVYIPLYETMQQTGISASSSSFTLFVNDLLSGANQIVAASVVFGTTSTSGTLQVEVATGTQAVGAGVNQLSSALSLSGTANTPVNGTLIASPTTVPIGGRINVILGGTLTGLANCCLCLQVARVV